MAMSNDHSDSPVSAASPPRGLEVISAEIAQCQKGYETSFLKIGQLLLEAKDQVGKHGEWLKWLRDNVDFSICTAQRLMGKCDQSLGTAERCADGPKYKNCPAQ